VGGHTLGHCLIDLHVVHPPLANTVTTCNITPSTIQPAASLEKNKRIRVGWDLPETLETRHKNADQNAEDINRGVGYETIKNAGLENVSTLCFKKKHVTTFFAIT